MWSFLVWCETTRMPYDPLFFNLHVLLECYPSSNPYQDIISRVSLHRLKARHTGGFVDLHDVGLNLVVAGERGIQHGHPLWLFSCSCISWFIVFPCFRSTHLFRMMFVVVENITLDPGYIGFFGRKRIMFEAYGIAHLVE